MCFTMFEDHKKGTCLIVGLLDKRYFFNCWNVEFEKKVVQFFSIGKDLYMKNNQIADRCWKTIIEESIFR